MDYYISVIQTCTFRFCWETEPTALQLPLLPQVPEEQKVLAHRQGSWSGECACQKIYTTEDTHIPSVISMNKELTECEVLIHNQHIFVLHITPNIGLGPFLYFMQ